MEKKQINKVVLGLLIFALILLIIFIIQNSDKITICFLGADFSAPLSVLVIVTLIIGFMSGLLFDAIMNYRKRKRKHEQELVDNYVKRVEAENESLRQQIGQK